MKLFGDLRQRPSGLIRRMTTCRWQCWICRIEVDDYLTTCPNVGAH